MVLDSAPLTACGELAATVAGVHTYSHHHIPDEMHWRSAWSIRARPAGSRPRQSVHPRHTCDTAWPALVTATPDTGTPATDDAPPY